MRAVNFVPLNSVGIDFQTSDFPKALKKGARRRGIFAAHKKESPQGANLYALAMIALWDAYEGSN
jgi:hypothetical protein